MIYLLAAKRLVIKEKFNKISICIGLYVYQLTFVPVPVRKQVNKWCRRFSGPFRFEKIEGILRETRCINLTEERRFCMIRSRLTDVVPAGPDVLTCAERTIAVVCNYCLGVCAAPWGCTVSEC